ncbi:hypothetical protein JET64_02720 [Pseudomonas putida]|nr:hypothetical protein [Pseudomonas putida]
METLIENAISGRSPEVNRATAVAAALELIAARITSPTLKQAQLEDEMDNLSKYADQIQQALNQK